MKLSREEHGIQGVKAILEYIDAGGPEQIDGDDYEVMGETEDGHDGCSTFSISQVACEAFATIEYLEAQRGKLREALTVMLEDYADACDEWDHENQEYGHKVIEQASDALKTTEE